METICRLCSFTCDEFKCLFEENGRTTEVYKISVKYFNSSLLDSGIICTECWQHIYNFYGFQQWIINAQANQINFQGILCEEKSIDSSSSLQDVPNESNASYKTLTDITINQMEMEQAKIERNPYKCETCGASFTLYGNLRRHVRKKHNQQPLCKWTCQYCKKTFKNRSYLEKHKSQIHANNDSDSDERFDIDFEEEDEYSNSTSTSSEIESSHQTKTECKKTKTLPQVFTIEDEEFLIKKENEIDLNVKSEVKQNSSQIHVPAIDIVDIKDETDSESDSNANNDDLPENILYTDINKENIMSYNDLIAKWKNNLECPKCKTNFTHFSMLYEHFRLQHSEERCYIICCDAILNDPRSIVQHMQLHEDPNAFKCNDCEKIFKSSRGLKSHKIQVHSENRSAYHLHLCYCKRAKELYAEYKSNEQNIEYNTIVCCQRKKKILEDDALIAEWQKNLKCHLCNDKTFPYFSLMRAHFYHEHPGEKCYISCCQRNIFRISDALDHIRFHLDPNMYKCNMCNITFSGKKGLAKHMNLTHGDPLPKYRWACDECDKSFKIRQILIRHKNVSHTKQV